MRHGADLDEYQVYSKDELNMVDDRVELSGNEKE